MAEITWKSILTKLVGGDHLTAEESEWFVDDLMQGNANPAAVGAALAMQEQLGLTADEVRGAAKAMVSHAVPLNVSGETTDIVGTGGDGLRHREPVHHGLRGRRRSRREDRQARQPRCIFEVRCRRCARSPWPAAGSEAGSRRRSGRRGGHHLRVRPHFPPGHAFRGADSRRAGHPVRLQHPGAADQPRQPGTRGHRLRQPQGEPDYGSRVRQPWTVWLGLHLSRGLGRTCPHRPGFRLGDSRRQGYRVRVRSDRGSGA